jgi:hypothetical protein
MGVVVVLLGCVKNEGCETAGASECLRQGLAIHDHTLTRPSPASYRNALPLPTRASRRAARLAIARPVWPRSVHAGRAHRDMGAVAPLIAEGEGATMHADTQSSAATPDAAPAMDMHGEARSGSAVGVPSRWSRCSRAARRGSMSTRLLSDVQVMLHGQSITLHTHRCPPNPLSASVLGGTRSPNY